MTPLVGELEELRKFHASFQTGNVGPDTTRCINCNTPWPCDAWRLLDALDLERSRGERLQERLDHPEYSVRLARVLQSEPPLTEEVLALRDEVVELRELAGELANQLGKHECALWLESHPTFAGYVQSDLVSSGLARAALVEAEETKK